MQLKKWKIGKKKHIYCISSHIEVAGSNSSPHSNMGPRNKRKKYGVTNIEPSDSRSVFEV